ncbi:MAG: DNA translocase FtsK, partial [Chlamydiota bacterium]|nr:DNA translocase FtsK [Chlamydiota bacterium]
NDIALAMKVGSVRIVAPIPGKSAVGIEVPNPKISIVRLRDLLEKANFRKSTSRLPIALGKDIQGNPILHDLADMPHLLIAGTTGSGKSISVQSIILSILFYGSPEYVRFLMIDPKMVELSVFNDLPHLFVPVITEPKKASAGLNWAVGQMDKRYRILAEIGVRNIEMYNEKVKRERVVLASAGDDTPLKPFPYIVIVIDELADLMTISSVDVESCIARLAQLARAVGIHLILATQRPSVDVITGVIKANFPARISFQVSSKVDSRTVLDRMGAEKLIGKGDMLFMPPGESKLIRAQSAYVSEIEVRKVVEFIKTQGIQMGEETEKKAFLEKINQVAVSDYSQMDDDTLADEAIKVITSTQQASVSILQRKMRIGYTRAARIMDLLEEKGVVGPNKGSKARDILIDTAEVDQET